VDQEIVHLLSAIKAGIVTITTKSELLSLEQERDQLQSQNTKADTVADFMPNTIGRFKPALADMTAPGGQGPRDLARTDRRADRPAPHNGRERALPVGGAVRGLCRIVQARGRQK
jgi:hypothetical protein